MKPLSPLALALSAALFCSSSAALLRAQSAPPTDSPATVETDEGEASAANREVGVARTAGDEAIADRIERILRTTDWYREIDVRSKEGVVFLEGRTSRQEFRTWARDLARNTEEVVAVVNRIEVDRRPVWDFAPAKTALNDLVRDLVPILPLVLVALAILAFAWLLARTVKAVADWWLRRSVANRLLRGVYSSALAIPVFLLGVYLVLRTSGLTQLAFTVIGGTGLFGLILGIAFRDITENFLASILISMQRPFEIGDRIEVDGERGFVQSVTTRGTLLMTLDGNHLHIPNSTIYKSTIRNFTSNPNMRLEFLVGIGYEDSVARTQSLLLDVARKHPATLDDPEPLVLVDELGPAAVALRVLFWVDSSKFSFQKVRSAVIRQAKRALVESGVSLPDAAREIVFPESVPVTIVERTYEATPRAEHPGSAIGKAEILRDDARRSATPDDTADASDAEGSLVSEASEIERQIERSRAPSAGDELLGRRDAR